MSTVWLSSSHRGRKIAVKVGIGFYQYVLVGSYNKKLINWSTPKPKMQVFSFSPSCYFLKVIIIAFITLLHIPGTTLYTFM